MRTYIAVTGVIFALVAVAHIARAFAEPRIVHDAFWIGLTILAAALSGWSVALLRRGRDRSMST